jgi:DNA mismatch endonuclease (patch repair protein)
MNMKTANIFDAVDPVRRKIMSAIRSRDTKPEKAVRSTLHAAGYRFRKHLTGLPGRPDIVFTKRRVAVFVHGCFWHVHGGCKTWSFPRTRSEYWSIKLQGNARRDLLNLAKLRADGWKTVVIWECQPTKVWLPKLKRILGPAKRRR